MIPTAHTLRARNRRVDHKLARAQAVLQAMEACAALHLQFTKHGPQWALTSGHQVSDDVAKLVIASSSVAGVGDALFHDVPCQTFRWWSAE
jgi:hypothetical protein